MDDGPLRIKSLDIARGLIMVIMALDHIRDYVHVDAFNFDPSDLSKTTVAVFFTRWVTHFCMPTFVLLSGTAIYIKQSRKSKREISRYLLTRGLWLIFLDLVVMRFALFFNFYYDVTFLSVLWLFGSCMILLSALIFFPFRILIALAVIITVGHNLDMFISIEGSNPFFELWTVMMGRGFIRLSPNAGLVVSYPVIPWLGVMLIGYALGFLYTNMDQQKRHQRLLQLGVSATILFVVLRFINLYGDPAAWSPQKNSLFTLLSFLNTTKYPVSLMFILMTVGPLLLLLAGLEKFNAQWMAPLHTIGKVPLFYFIAHFYIIHAFALLFAAIKTGQALSEIDFHFVKSFGGITSDGRFSLLVVYLFWIGAVLIMYPLCKWYANKKSTNKKWWMSYL